MLDRARIGSVIDFVHMYYKAWSFAVFDFADAAITVGVIATVASTCLETLGAGSHGEVSRCIRNSLHFRFWHLSDACLRMSVHGSNSGFAGMTGNFRK
jgi:hypothetical protein